MAENIADMTITLRMQDQTSGALNTISKRLEQLSRGSVDAQKQFGKLAGEIYKLGEAGSNRDSRSRAKQMMADVNKVKDTYIKLNNEMKRAGSIGADIDKEKMKETLSQLKTMQQLLASFYKSGNLSSVNKGLISNTLGDFAEFNKFRDFSKDVVTQANKMYGDLKKASDTFMKNEQSINKKLMTSDIRMSEFSQKLAMRAAARRDNEIEASGPQQIKSLQKQFHALSSLHKKVVELQKSAPEASRSSYNHVISNIKQEQRRSLDMLSALGSTSKGNQEAFAKRVSSGDKQAMLIANMVESGSNGASAFNKRFFDKHDVDVDRIRKRYSDANLASGSFDKAEKDIVRLTVSAQKLEGVLNLVKSTTFGKNVDTKGIEKAQQEVERLIKSINDMKSQVEGGKTIRIPVALGNDVYNAKKNLKSEYDSVLSKLSKEERERIKIERQNALAYRNADENQDKIARANQQIKGLKEIINKANEAKKGLNESISTRSLDNYVNGAQKLIEKYQKLIEGLKESPTKKHHVPAQLGLDATMLKSKIRDRISNVTSQQKQLNKEDTKRGEQILKLNGYVHQLENELKKLGSKRYAPDVDTSKIDNAKRKIEALIVQWRMAIEQLNKGGNLQNMAVARDDRKRVLSDLQTARALTNAEAARFRSTERAYINAMAQENKTARDLARNYASLQTAASGASNTIAQLKSLFYQFAPVYGVQQLVMSLIKVGGEIEKQHIALQSIVGDLHNANDLFADIKNLALSSPFKFGELNADVKQLAAYGVETENLYDTTKRLADISSGLGVSFERIALAYGQVKARSWLDGKELRQFAYAGVPMLKNLSDMYSKTENRKVSTSEVRSRVQKREVPFEDVQKVLWEMTDEGGKFFNMQEVLSETLLGRYNKLIDAWEIMLSDFAKGDSVIGGTFKTILNMITSIVLAMHSALPVVTAFFSGFALKKAAYALTGIKMGSKSNAVEDRVLSAKQNVVVKLEQERLTRELTARENELLATKNRVTMAEYKTLAATRQLTSADIERLMIAKRISAEQAKELAAAAGVAVSTNRAVASMSLALSTMGNGIMNGLKGVYGFFGGWVGMAITAVSMLAMRFSQMSSEAEQFGKNAADEIRDRYKNIKKYIEDNPINFKGSTKETLEQIRDMKQELRDIMPNQSASIFANQPKGDDKTILKYYDNQLKMAQEALSKSEEIGAVLEKAKYKSTHFWGGGYKSVVSEAAGGWQDMSAKLSSKSVSDTVKNQIRWNGLNEFTARNDKDFNNFIIPIQHYLKEVPARIRPAIIEMMRQSAQEGMNEYEKVLFGFEYDKALGLDNLPSVVSLAASKAGEALSDTLKEKLRTGAPITKAESEDLDKAIKATLRDFEGKYGFMYNDIQRVISSRPFIATIHARIVGLDKPNELLQFYQGQYSPVNKDKPLVDAKLSNLLKEGSVTKALSSSRSEIKELKEEIKDKALKGADSTQDKERLKIVTEAYHVLGGKDGELDGSKKKGYSHRGPDLVLKAYQKRAEAIKKLIALYKELRDLYGATTAAARVNALAAQEGIKGYDFSDPVEARRKLAREAPTGTEERKEYKRILTTEGEDEQRKKEEEGVKAVTKANEELNEQYKSQYELRDKLRSKFGTKYAEIATRNYKSYSSENGGRRTNLSYLTNAERLKNNVKQGIAQSDHPKTNIYKALNMNDEDLENNFGKDSKLVSNIKALREERIRIQQEAIEAIEGQNDKLDNEVTRLAKIDAKYDEEGRKIARWDVSDGKGGIDKGKREMRDSALAINEQSRAFEKSTATDDYKQFKRAAWSMTGDKQVEVYYTALEALNNQLATGLIAVEDYNKQVSELDNVFVELSKRKDAFTHFSESNSRAGALLSLNNSMIRGGDTSAVIDAKTAKRTGLKEGQRYSREQVGDMTSDAMKELASSTDGVIKAFGGLSDVLSPVKDMFDALGIGGGLGDALGAADSAMSGAQKMGGGLQTLSQATGDGTSGISGILSKAGPYGAAAGAAIGMVTSLFGDPDKAKEEEIKETQRTNKLLEHIADMIDKEMDYLAGKAYTWNMDKRLQDEYKQKLFDATHEKKTVMKSLGKFQQQWVLKGNLSENTKKKMSIANNTGEYFDTMLATKYAQIDNYRHMIDEEQSKKNVDDSRIDDWNKKIDEMRLEIQKFTQETAQTLYGIDVSSYAQSIAKALVNAWASGTNSVKAYKDAVGSAMKSVAQTVVEQKIVGRKLDSLFEPWFQRFENKSGLMDDSLFADLANIFASVQHSVDEANTFMDSWEKVGNKYGYTMKDSSQSSMSSNISSITEDTADLLASYVNAIRADVSVNRVLLQQMAEETFPNMSATMNLSLVELRGIKSTLDAMAYNMEDVRDMIHDMSLGNRAMTVRMSNIA